MFYSNKMQLDFVQACHIVLNQDAGRYMSYNSGNGRLMTSGNFYKRFPFSKEYTIFSEGHVPVEGLEHIRLGTIADHKEKWLRQLSRTAFYASLVHGLKAEHNGFSSTSR